MNIESFEKWLVEEDNKATTTAYNYKTAIPYLEKHYNEIKDLNINLFDLNINDLEDVVVDYGREGKYSEIGDISSGTYRSAMNALLRYKKEQHEELDSTIQPKDILPELDKNKLSEYWVKYKEYFKKPAKEHKEKYKWNVLKQVYEKWDWNVEDKAEMFKNAFEVEGLKNLWLSGNFFPIGHTNFMFAKFPDETIEIFHTLFNEAILLTERINTFIDFYNFKLPELQKIVPEKKLNYHSHNDLRAIALYLSLQYPEKYYLYKHSMVKAFCEKLEMPSIKSGEKENLGKFIRIANEVLDFIEKDIDFIKEYRSFTAEEGNYNDESLHLLTQDFIYTIGSHFATNDGLRFKEIIEELKELVLLEDSPIKDYNFEETASDYVWILDNDKINDVNVHYEIYRIPKTKSLTINIHFESKNKSENDFFERNIQLPDDFEWFKWEKSKSIRLKERYNLDSENIVGELFDGLIQFEASVGELVRKAISNKSLIVNTNTENRTKMKFPLNQILYGAPGTGKTFKTKELAVEIITGNKIKNREELTKEYDRLKKNNQINFTTFHQSISYEDFVEGIKPVLKSEDEDEDKITKDSQIEYEIKDGIFKKLCQLSEGVTSKVEVVENFNFQNKDFFKMSLGGKHRLEKHNWSIKNNLIFLGWGGDKDFSRLNKIKDWKLFRDAFKKDFPDLVSETKYVIQAVYIFQKMKIGDIVIISKGNKIIDAIGIIESEYFFDDTKDIDHYQFRKVKWLATDMNVSPEIFVSKGISQQTIYQFYNDDINIEAFNENFKKQTLKEEPKKHVLIIDEINRGNISAIFGELITLIEEDKRKGILKPNIEALEVELPYSREKFSVPDNLYIIGTMNTADRSVESLDTALRRRFSFVEMQPNLDVLKEEHITNGIISIDTHVVDMVKMLEMINKRIEILIDKDHKIGHSFFINISNFQELQLVFKDKIIPLLEEYFFGDFGKIGLILGTGFIEKADVKDKVAFADFDHEDRDILREKEIYLFTQCDKWEANDFIQIYK